MSVHVELDDVSGEIREFRSPRLIGTRIGSGDGAFLEMMHTDPEVMATIGGVRDSEESEAWLAANIDHWVENGFGYWTLRLRDGTPIGRGGLRWIDECVGERLVEVGYSLKRSAWGQGYATEAVDAFMAIAADRYGFTELGAIVLLGNRRSVRVLEKSGFSFERTVRHADGTCRFLRKSLTPVV